MCLMSFVGVDVYDVALGCDTWMETENESKNYRCEFRHGTRIHLYESSRDAIVMEMENEVVWRMTLVRMLMSEYHRELHVRSFGEPQLLM